MNKLILSFLYTAILVFAIACTQQPSTVTVLKTGSEVAVADTRAGKVRGYIRNGIFTYKGIPYAHADRFMAPEKVAPWDGIRSAMTYGPVCPLMDPTTSVSDEIEFVFHHDWGYPNEDCLRLNIWTPEIKQEGAATGKRPVMVWLHGGGHTAGSSQELPSYDGENLARKGDVVVVSINHRLNILGFLDLSAYGEKYAASPNASIRDIVSALEWVKENIASFGGDPGNVMIFGQSGGGGKVNTLLNTPAAKGLFHKAVIESGGLGLHFTDPEVTHRVAAAVLEELKLKPTEVDSLQKIPYPALAAAGKKAMQRIQEQMRAAGQSLMPLVGLSWGPILDGTFLPYQPTDPKARELSSDIPLLIGSTKNEFMTSLRVPSLRNAPLDTVESYINKQYGDRAEQYLAGVRKAYPNDTRPSDLVDVDVLFRRSAIKMADIKAASSAPVYMYLFTWQSPVLDGAYKSLHCMEIAFAFDNIARCEQMTGGTPEAYALADKISNAWIAFSKTGNPNHSGLPNWPAYTPENGLTMLLDNTCEVKAHHDQDLLAAVPDVSF